METSVNNKCRSFTSLEQSKKLADILPIESADMYWDYDVQKHEDYPMVMDEQFDDTCVRAWSLSALLDIIPARLNGYKDMVIRLRMDKGDAGPDEYNLWYEDISTGVTTSLDVEAGDFVDACVEMIIKLKEKELI